ncbi:hypothetical protein BGX24_003765 [Mortierella sp. AD032]|nr:hypothetical protein BGX24_003765 [Mortierella sp. AD032]
MIISTYFWVASITITIIKTILSGSIGAIVGFYVKYSGDEFSNSIRWSRTGGFYEMIALYRNSHGGLSIRSRTVMILLIFASLSTLFVTIPLGASVSRTKRPANPANQGVFSRQPLPTDPFSWTDWIAYMEADATMEGTMSSLLNDTGFNLSPSPRTVYTPRTYPYDVLCTETGAVISKSPNGTAYTYLSPHNNCKAVFLGFDGKNHNWDDKRASNQLISPGVHMIVAPITFLDGTIFDFDPIFYGKACLPKTPAITYLDDLPKDGLTSLPRTDATRCQFRSGRSFTMAITSIKFAVNHLIDFDKVTATFMDDPSNLHLLKTMRTAIDNAAFASATNSSTMVLLTNMADNVDFLVCASVPLLQPNDMGFICTYIVTATIATTPQPWDPTIITDLNRSSPPPVDKVGLINRNEISVYHMPLGSRDNMTTYSAAHLLKATTDATKYFASLGHNVYLDKEAMRFYVLYDTIELMDAFEISTSLLIVLGCVVVVCSAIWGFSETKYPAVFNGSLYKLIYQEIKSKEKKAPMIMDFKHDPLAFNGYQVIPDLDELQLMSTQQWPMESEILVQSSSLTAQSCSTTTTSTIAPITIDTNNPTGATYLIPFPVQTTSSIPTMAPPIPPRPLESHRNFTSAPPIQSSPPLHTATHYIPFPVQTSSIPTMAPPVPPRPLESHRNFTPAPLIQPSPPLHTATHLIQDAPSSTSANQESTLIQNPFW